ncbi:ribosomal-protein-alanine N-acetyltransferase [Acidovorax soli]|uniref:Ribosomal-protein-alanine N-acetyltransferase n=1 Tax=Acidovorax soli TaxID=592050 RepID=A0A7X0UD94_9BURK|nr:GNAT family N-acetyltransferase [Acidovorax soli]MBB6564242.1 ribosomal-protein-alanine N-acetyltransferase [Acidovorax soli]
MTTRRKPSTTTRVRLLPLHAGYQQAFLAAVRASRALHRPWVSPPATPEQFAAYAERMQAPSQCGLLVVLQNEAGTPELAGVVNITNMVMGPFCSAYLGYYAFAGFERQGLMREGLTQAVRHAFRTLKLHRLEANIQPGNTASLALVRSCGFSKEGYSPRYLKIGGRWRDHERWAIVAS